MKIWLLDHIMKGTLSPVGQHTFAFPFWVEQLLPVPLHPLRWAGSAGLWGKSHVGLLPHMACRGLGNVSVHVCVSLHDTGVLFISL